MIGQANQRGLLGRLQRATLASDLAPRHVAEARNLELPDQRYEAYRRSVDFIQKYIFPGGYLPTLAHISVPMGEHGLVMNDMENLRLHYAHTLDSWIER